MNRLAHEPEEKNIPGNPRNPRFSGTATYCVFQSRQTRFCTILQNSFSAAPGAANARRNQSQNLQLRNGFSRPVRYRKIYAGPTALPTATGFPIRSCSIDRLLGSYEAPPQLANSTQGYAGGPGDVHRVPARRLYGAVPFRMGHFPEQFRE